MHCKLIQKKNLKISGSVGREIGTKAFQFHRLTFPVSFINFYRAPVDFIILGKGIFVPSISHRLRQVFFGTIK